jgi:hypothetical protein
MKHYTRLAICIAFAGFLADGADPVSSFSGTWKMNLERSTFGHPSNWTHGTYEGPLRMFWRPILRVDSISYDEPNLKDAITVSFAEGARPEVIATMNYNTDGRRTINYPEGKEYESKAKWEKAADGLRLGERRPLRKSRRHDELAIKTKPVPWSAGDSIEERWSLSEDGHTLTIRRYINLVMDQTIVFERQ